MKTFDEWFQTYYMGHHVPRIGNETDWENGQYYRNLQKKYNEYVKDWKENDSINDAWTTPEDDKKGLERPLCDGDTWLQCYGCHYWFKESNNSLRPHDCSCIFATFPASLEGELIKFKFELDRPVESEAWAKPLVTIPNPESVAKLVTPLSTQEAAPIVETPTEEPDPEPIQQDTIDLDIAGRYPMPIDYQYQWIQCKFEDCQKWFKTKELRNKHLTKYYM